MPRPRSLALAALAVIGAGLLVFGLLPHGADSDTPPAAPGSEDHRPSGHSHWLTIHRVHDLLSEYSRAHLSVAGSRSNSTLKTVNLDAFGGMGTGLLAVPGTTIEYSDLQTGAGAQLLFGVGSLDDTAPAAATRRVTFRIDGRRHSPRSGPAPAWIRLFRRTVSLADLPWPTPGQIGPGVPATRRVRFHQLPLPDADPGSWDLRFATSLPGRVQPDDPPAWPAWIRPQLVSDGLRVSRQDHPVRLERHSRDLLEELAFADIQQQPADLPVALANLDAAPGTPVYGGLRRCLRTAAPSRLSWQLKIPPEATLLFDFGMDADTGWSLPGDGMVFSLSIDEETVWQFDCLAPSLHRQRGWKSAALDLGPWANREVELSVATAGHSDLSHDVGGWSRLDLMTGVTVPRLLVDEAPTVVILLADTLRADAIGVFGGAAGSTPAIDALVRRGLRFTSARATSSWTWPSTASLLTGLYPTEHGLVDHEHTWLDADVTTLSEAFQSAGYTTAAFVANALIDESSSLNQGFETFVTLPQVTAGSLCERIEAWLEDTDGTARLLYVHFMDPHAPYAPPAPWLPAGAYDPSADLEAIATVMDAVRSGAIDDAAVLDFQDNLSTRYQAEVHYLDFVIGNFLALLRRHGALDDALVVFTADHGEEFGEHQLLSHGGQLYDETLRVPLSITGFGPSALQPATISRPVLNMDLFPTLCSLAGLSIPAAVARRPLLLGEHRPEPTFAQTLHGFDADTKGFVEKLSVTFEGFKLISTPRTSRVELYDLSADPGELSDVSAQQPDRAAALLKLLTDWRDDSDAVRPSTSADDPQEMLRRMRQLGYIER